MGSLIGYDLMQPALQYNAPFLITLGVHVLDPPTPLQVHHHEGITCATTERAKSKMADDAGRAQKALDDRSAAASRDRHRRKAW